MDKEKAINVCKMGQGKDCCKYLGAGMKGLECLKNSDFRKLLDNMKDMVAQSDNCEEGE